MGAATPSGVLRALDRFDLISWPGTSTPIARAILAGIAFVAGAPFAGLCRHLVRDRPRRRPLHLVPRLARASAPRPARRHSPDLAPDHSARRLAVRDPRQPGDQRAAVWGPIARLVVGGLLGPAGAALFRVASTLADSAQKPADLLAKAFYPEVVRMDLTSKKPWKLMLRGTRSRKRVARRSRSSPAGRRQAADRAVVRQGVPRRLRRRWWS